MKNMRTLLAIAAAAALSIVTNAHAASLLGSYTITGTGGRSATADFYNDAGNLRIDLTNTGNAAAILDGSYIITAFWFKLNGTPTLNYLSATASDTITGFSADANQTATKAGATADETSNWVLPTSLKAGFSYGIGTAGNPGGGGTFGPGAQGFNDGLLPSGPDFPTMNSGTQDKAPFASPTISFLFSINGPYTLNSASLGNCVAVGYGTSGTEPGATSTTPLLTVPPVPLPAAAWSGMVLLGGLGLSRIVKRRVSQ